MKALILALTVAAPGVALAAPCEAPIEPAIVDDAARYSRDDMLKLFRSVKTFQVQAVRYRECLQAHKSDIGEAGYVDLHNASIAAEEFVAERFNEVFARFKERTSGAR